MSKNKDWGESPIEPKPCPNCGGTEVAFLYSMSYGHGESGFDHGRISCKSCDLSIQGHKNEVMKQWNNLKR